MTRYFKMKEFFEGKIDLWKSFWLVGELIYGVILILIIQFDRLLLNSSDNGNEISFFYFNDLNIISKIILFFWTLYISVGVWRAAENYRGWIIWVIITFVYISYRVFSLRLLFF